MTAKNASDSLPRDAGRFLEITAAALSGWHQEYFQHIDPAILDGLRAEAECRRAMIGSVPPVELVEIATAGLEYQPEPGPEEVLLIPQYHFRPWNLYRDWQGVRVFQYPVDAVQPRPGEPPPAFLRLARALSDDSRLRILRFLAAGPASFTEIVRAGGLAKSTVHHHMVVLRAAGLVRVHHIGKSGDTYTLRDGAVDTISDVLRGYLTAPNPDEGRPL
jgi:DNA-binding transcriptional ArsR family regulator